MKAHRHISFAGRGACNRVSPGAAAALLAVLTLVAGSFALVGCTARHTPPVAPPLEFTDPKLEHGKRVFYQHCHMCHPHGGAGLGPAIVNKPLPSFLMKFQVRHGLGAMPSLKEEKISDEDLDALMAYIKAVMANKPVPAKTQPR